MILPTLKNRRSPKFHRFRGEWMTVKEIASLTGIIERTIHRRIQYGLPIDEPPRFGPEPKRYEFRGELMTARQIMAITGLSRSQVSKRTDGIRFFDLDEPTDPYAGPPANARVLFFHGISDSIAGWSRRTGIPHYVIRERILTMKWPLKRALTEPVMRKGQRIRYQRNAEIIRHMLDGFHASPVIAGGYQQTFTTSPGTGVGSTLRDLQSEKMNG